jgi:DNA-binding HxlR family transcriptional regulator
MRAAVRSTIVGGPGRVLAVDHVRRVDDASGAEPGKESTLSVVREPGVSPGRPDSRQAVHLPRSERRLVEQIELVLELLQGKWKVPLLFLMARGVHRHCKLLEGLRAASKKMMTDTLRALERDGLVRREIFAEVPLRVEYSLTPLGWAITEPLMALAEWDETHREEVECARLRYRVGNDRAVERIRGSAGNDRRSEAAGEQ